MFSQTATLAAFFSLGSAHMIMTSPKPFGVSLNNSPLNNVPDGTFTGTTDYPCKQRGANTYALAASQGYTPMAIGSSNQLAFIGSAVHGGGSCQVSVSYDLAPSTTSTFKVIHSIEGGCPMQNIAGNNGDDAALVNPDKYNYTIPAGIPTGKAVLAWTWFNKVGNREMYMNCAPIEITGTNATSTAAYDALPDVFVANTGVDSCATTEGTDLQFPNAGKSVVRFNPSDKLALPTGNCPGGTTLVGGNSTTAASSSGSSASPAASSPVASVVPAAASTPVASVTPATSSSPAASISNPATSGTASPGVQKAGSTCTTPNMYNCISGTSFQQCASGTWSAVQSVAAGTTCTAGQSMTLTIAAIAAKSKRAIRFSGEHARWSLL